MPELKTLTVAGSRFYEHPVTGQQVPGVTTVIDVLSKPALPRWAAKETANFAVANRKSWQDLDEQAAIDLLKGAPWRMSGGAMSKGTEIHAIAEKLLVNDPVDFVPPDIQNAVRGVAQIIEWLKPEPIHIESSLWNMSKGYAGTCDLIATIDGETWLLDWKSSKDVYPDNGLQIAAYSRAEVIIKPDGTETPMPKIDKFAVCHVPKEGKASLVMIDVTDADFEAFCAALAVFEWRVGRAKEIIKTKLPVKQTTN
jgi:hypothetical protein